MEADGAMAPLAGTAGGATAESKVAKGEYRVILLQAGLVINESWLVVASRLQK